MSQPPRDSVLECPTEDVGINRRIVEAAKTIYQARWLPGRYHLGEERHEIQMNACGGVHV
jgi:hypothetical protein